MPKGVYHHEKGRIITWGDKISEAKKGKKFSEEHKINLSKSHKGWKWSEEEKEKRRLGMLDKNKGRKLNLTDEQRKSLSDRAKGRKHSDETKIKIGLSSRGKTCSLESIEKIRKFLVGRRRPDLCGENNPMHKNKNAYKSKFGKVGFRKDLNGVFRSTWEANMMRIFKFLGLNVEYEPLHFPLSNGFTYFPDFFIHDTGEFIEVKGRKCESTMSRFNQFIKDYPNISIDLIDSPKYLEYKKEFINLIPNWE